MLRPGPKCFPLSQERHTSVGDEGAPNRIWRSARPVGSFDWTQMTITFKTIGSIARRGSALLPQTSRGVQLPAMAPRARAFSQGQRPRGPVVKSVNWHCLTNPDSIQVQDALKRQRQDGDAFQATIADVDAANNLLWAARGEYDRLARSTTFDGLRRDLSDVHYMQAGEPARLQMLQDLFRAQMDLMASRAPGLLEPVHNWEFAISSEVAAPVAPDPAAIFATFTLQNGQAVSLRAVRPDDPQALTAFLDSLPWASYRARFPRMEGSKQDLAIDTIHHALHPDPCRRRVSLVLVDSSEHIVGLLDFHERGEPLMKTAVESARAQGLSSPRLGLKTCELDLVVAKVLQGQQLGQPLLHFAIKHASDAGYEQIVGVVADANKAALSNLAKMGVTHGFPLIEAGYKLYVLKPGPDAC